MPPWGCPEHIDSGLVTIILSNAPGLQVFDQLDESWVDAEIAGAHTPQLRECTATVLVGHTLEVASDGAYKACRHRVRQTDRTSVVLKLHAQGSARLSTTGFTVDALLSEFERQRPSVNPQPDSSRVSAVAGSLVTVENRSLGAALCPRTLVTFKEDHHRFALSRSPPAARPAARPPGG